MSKSGLGFSAAIACAMLLSSNARALGDEIEPDPRATLPLERDPALFPSERPWLYVDDAQIAKPGAVTAYTRGTYTSVGASPTRPFGGDLAHPGSVFEAGAEVGLTSWLSASASGFGAWLSRDGTSDGVTTFGTMLGFRLAPLDLGPSTHVSASGGFLREMSGAQGAWGRVSLAHDFGRATISGTVHGEHIFQTGRDGIDLMIMAGASYRLTSVLRAGLEYVAQDLEGVLGDDGEGMRHFVSPTLGVDLLDRRLMVTAGPALGLSKSSPSMLGRLGIAYAF
jgi:hypothetical protein